MRVCVCTVFLENGPNFVTFHKFMEVNFGQNFYYLDCTRDSLIDGCGVRCAGERRDGRCGFIKLAILVRNIYLQ